MGKDEEEENEKRHQKMIVVYDCCMQSRHLSLRILQGNERNANKTQGDGSRKINKNAIYPSQKLTFLVFSMWINIRI